MSKLLNFYDDALKVADDIADATRAHSRKAKNLSDQMSIFDEIPTHELAGFSRNKPVYQPNLAGLYDNLAPNVAQSDEYLRYLNNLSDTQIQNLLPQRGLDLTNAQTDSMVLQSLQELSQTPDTQGIAEVLRKHIK